MMRKFFCKNDADDFEDLPAFNEDKVSLTMMIAGICAGGCGSCRNYGDDCLPAPQE